MRKEAQEQDVREKMEQEERELRAQREAEWVRKIDLAQLKLQWLKLQWSHILFLVTSRMLKESWF